MVTKMSSGTVNPSPIDLNADLVSAPSPQKLEKAKKIINSMVANGTLTAPGEAWLKLNTDPWHDTKTNNYRGTPARQTNQVVTMSVVQEINISKPAALGPGNWSVRIGTLPLGNKVPVKTYSMVGNALYGTTVIGSERTMWPVTVDYILDGTGDFPSTGSITSTGIEIPAEFRKGPFRVDGMGLEVINTTATIAKQGLGTFSVMNQNTTKVFTANMINSQDVTAVASPWTPASSFMVKTLPANLKEMLLLPGTAQWEAAEGAYSVIQLLELDQPTANIPLYPIIHNSEVISNILVDPTPPTAVNLVSAVDMGSVDTASAGISGTFQKVWTPRSWSSCIPMNSTVHMYTGLSETTTLTLRVRFLITRYPNDNEPEILVLAYNNAEWDPVAIELQSRMMSQLPPAVMFKMNPKGEWWKIMLAGIADIASSGLMMMPHPLAKGAGAAIAAGRAILAPDTPVKFQARQTKNQLPPAERETLKKKGGKKKGAKKQPKKKKKAPESLP